MVVFPNSKINLGLHILSKRKDGYHSIASCFYPIPFCDILEVVKNPTFHFESTGIAIPGERDNNLCVKAFRMLQSDYHLDNVHIHLHKVVPIGAGLGGGSADATFTLKTIDALFDLQLSSSTLAEYASRLGSDCPFFIENKPVMATGTGTTFEPCSVDLKGKYLVLVYPEIHISTQEAYAGVTPKTPEKPLADTLKTTDSKLWQTEVKNDFEVSIVKRHPVIEETKTQLYEAGAFYASMTGSGSAIFGLFDTEVAIDQSIGPICWKGWL